MPVLLTNCCLFADKPPPEFMGTICAVWAAVVLVLALAGVGLARLRRGGRAREYLRLRAAVLAHLGLPVNEESAEGVRQRILALVPCEGWLLHGSLAALPRGRRLWLCFLADRLLDSNGRPDLDGTDSLPL